MRTPQKTKKNGSATLLVPAAFVASLLLVASTGSAQETGTQQWGTGAGAKAFSASRPVVVNAEEVDILRRLLALTAAAEASAAQVVWDTCDDVNEGFTALTDSEDGSSDSRVPVAQSEVW